MIVTFETTLKGVTRKGATYGQHTQQITLEVGANYTADLQRDQYTIMNLAQARLQEVREQAQAIMQAMGESPITYEEYMTAMHGDKLSPKPSKGIMESIALSLNNANTPSEWGVGVEIGGVRYIEHNGNHYLKGKKIDCKTIKWDTPAPAPKSKRATLVKNALKKAFSNLITLETSKYRTYLVDPSKVNIAP